MHECAFDEKHPVLRVGGAEWAPRCSFVVEVSPPDGRWVATASWDLPTLGNKVCQSSYFEVCRPQPEHAGCLRMGFAGSFLTGVLLTAWNSRPCDHSMSLPGLRIFPGSKLARCSRRGVLVQQLLHPRDISPELWIDLCKSFERLSISIREPIFEVATTT
jgi:hypothetical protein